MTIKYDFFMKFTIFSAVFGAGISYSKVYLFHIALLLLLIAFFLKKNPHNGVIKVKKLPTKLHYLFGCMFLWYSLSIIWSPSMVYSLPYVFYIFFGSVIALSVIYYSNDLIRQDDIFNLVSKVFIFELILSILEIFTDIRWPISPFSPYANYFGHDTDVGVEAIDYLIKRSTGFEWNPNNLAIIMCMISPFFLFHKNRWITLLGTVAILVVVIASASRGNFIALLLIFLLYAFAYNKKRAVKALLFLIISMPLLVVGIHYAESLEIDTIQRVLSAVGAVQLYLFDDASGMDSIGVRQLLIKNGINALIDSYGFGVGGGGARAIQEQTTYLTHTSAMHNFWLEMLVESGVFFASLFYLWYSYLIYRLCKIYMYSSVAILRYYAAATSLSMIGFVVAAVTASSVIYELPMWLLFGFAIATINNDERIKFDYENTIFSRSSVSTHTKMG